MPPESGNSRGLDRLVAFSCKGRGSVRGAAPAPWRNARHVSSPTSCPTCRSVNASGGGGAGGGRLPRMRAGSICTRGRGCEPAGAIGWNGSLAMEESEKRRYATRGMALILPIVGESAVGHATP